MACSLGEPLLRQSKISGILGFFVDNPEYAFALYIAAMSLAAFAMYGIDKLRAIKGRRRIRERTLLSVSALGEALGGLIAMQLFRHKTLHAKFYAVNGVALAAHAAIFILTANLGG